MVRMTRIGTAVSARRQSGSVARPASHAVNIPATSSTARSVLRLTPTA